MTFRLAVISAGLSQPSSTRLLADRLAAAATVALRADGHEVEATTVELRPLAHEITDAMLSGFASGALSEALTAVAGADALIAVTPVFAGSYAGLFKSFVDIVPRGDLAGLPVLLTATGGSPRHSLAIDHALRPLFAYHQAVTVPTGIFAATADFGSADARHDGQSGDGLSARIARAAAELVRLAEPVPRGAVPRGAQLPRRDGDRESRPGIAATREEDVATQFTPFAELLAGRAR